MSQQLYLPYYASNTPIFHRIRMRSDYYSQKFGFTKKIQKTRNKKTCSNCSESKPINFFPKNRNKCKICTNEAMVRYRVLNGYTCKYYPEQAKEYRLANYHKRQEYQFKLRIKALLLIQSDLKCVRCGCNDIRFLEINHKNGDGRIDLFSSRYRNIVNRILYEKRKTDDLEILCRPCNHIHYLEVKYGEKIPLKTVFEKEIVN